MIDELLREARPNPAPPDATVTLRARRAVLRQAVAGRVRRRYATRAGVLVTAAAAVLAVLGVVQSPEHGASPAAAAILDKSAARIEQTMATTPGEYVYRREITTTWGYSESPRIDDSIETWIPVEENQPLIQRTTDENGDITFAVVDLNHTEAHAIYRDHPTQPAAMLDALRDYARTVQGDASDSAVWGSAFSLLADSQTPDDIRADVVRALSRLDGVEVADRRVPIGSRFGVSLRYDEKYAPELIFDPSDGSFLGMRGFPEIDKSWVGPHKPMWTIRFETKIVDSAPTPPASQMP